MMPIDLSHPAYHDDNAARELLEGIRWPNGVTCPHCGSIDQARALAGKSMGPGWFYCGACKDKFTVRTGTVYERSHIPLHKWTLGFRLFASSKKGFSAHQLHRTLGITYKSAWFMAHRIREAMTDGDPAPLGGKDKVVEIDEAYTGPTKVIYKNKGGWMKKQGANARRDNVLSLVERGGRARSFRIHEVTLPVVAKVLAQHVHPESTVHTDTAGIYKSLGKKFAKHESVNHTEKEYARGNVTTNTVEGFFSIFKRGMTGIYQHCGEQHLRRYLAEFDFRYSYRVACGYDDAARTLLAIKGAEGKRLTYIQSRIRDAA